MIFSELLCGGTVVGHEASDDLSFLLLRNRIILGLVQSRWVWPLGQQSGWVLELIYFHGDILVAAPGFL